MKKLENGDVYLSKDDDGEYQLIVYNSKRMRWYLFDYSSASDGGQLGENPSLLKHIGNTLK